MMELDAVDAIFANFPKAVEEFQALRKYEIVRCYYDLVYGVTPAIFVVYRKDGDEFLERIRLER